MYRSRAKAGSPCGACRELIMQLDKNYINIEILQDEEMYEWNN